MMTSEQLKTLFPAESDITGEHGRPEPMHQPHWLVGGELRPWTGRVQTVRSAICVRKGDGSLEQVELGSYPMGGIPEAEEALAAAVAAPLRGARLEILDCGHEIPIERPRHLAALIDSFVAELQRTAPEQRTAGRPRL